ncbi:GTPase-associated system all-helical protein GASH, partial [Salmonella sp. hn-h2]|uniref:GTPase-associated system all-helical protein GASH n=1 Tax=Salmonella sp. hn-h2 TaxID=2582611 RepID=UPI003FA788D4
DSLSGSLCETAKELESSWEGRSPVIAVLGHFTHETLGGVAFRQTTGFDDHVQMRPHEWGAHLFRELQAARAIQPSGGKRLRSR